MKSFLALTSLLASASAFCDHGTTLFPRADDHVKVANFSYGGVRGALNWHGIDAANQKCATGTQQSPIDVVTASHSAAVKGSSLKFDIQSYQQGAELLNLGSTLEVVANGTLGLNGVTYKLAQFHFHTPSEHHVDGEYYPGEIHFVFQAEDKSLSVVGFLLELDSRTDPLVANVLKNADKVREPGTVGTTGKLDFARLRDHLRASTVYQYGGSLTTPPCTEGIKWNVVRDPLPIDAATFKLAKGIMKFNSRYTQNVPGQANLLEVAKKSLV